jgi:hypothetical protein
MAWNGYANTGYASERDYLLAKISENSDNWTGEYFASMLARLDKGVSK